MSQGRPTLGDVARLAGVHKATASRALNDATAVRVNPATADRVRQAARDLGYRPNPSARDLRTRSSRTVGVLIPNVLSALYPPLVHGIERTLRGYDRVALVADSENDATQEPLALEHLLDRRVDGLIAAAHLTGRPLVYDVAARGTPVVFLETTTEAPGHPHLSSVAPETGHGVDLLVDLLVAHGHRRIAHLAGPDTHSDTRERAAMHVAAFARHGLDLARCPEIVANDYTIAAGRVAGGRALHDHPEVTALMAYNDLVAIGAMQAVRDAGLRCPEDVSVTGFNDIPLVDALSPPLTTVRLDTMRQGREAAEVLMGMIADPSALRHRIVPVTLQIRGSHGPAPTARRR